MKSAVADYKNRIFAIRIEATDGVNVVRFVDFPHDLDMGGNTYQADSGYEMTTYSATHSAAPSIIDLQGVLEASGIDLDSINSGIWDNAKGFIFATSWANPTEDEEPIAKFLFGKISLRDDRYVVELIHLIDAISQSVGRSHGPLCPWTLFDENLDGDTVSSANSKCGLSLASYKVTGTITHVTDNGTFRDSARAEADDYFGVGAIRFTSGLNQNVRSHEIKTYASVNQTVTLFESMPYTVQVGDTYEMIPGCRKRLAEDCRDKYSNVVNGTSGGFGGFPHMITQQQYMARGRGG